MSIICGQVCRGPHFGQFQSSKVMVKKVRLEVGFEGQEKGGILSKLGEIDSGPEGSQDEWEKYTERSEGLQLIGSGGRPRSAGRDASK